MNRKLRLLIVEDESAIRNGLVDVFVFHGYEVDSVDDGREGLRLAQTGRFDLVLLDVMLPGIDGFEICDRIRQDDREQPIIMLTAKTADEDIIQGLRLGADDYVAKPFSIAQLVLRVEAVLRRSRVAAEHAAAIYLGDSIEIDTDNLCGKVRGEVVEGQAVRTDGHAEDDDIGLGDDIRRIGAGPRQGARKLLDQLAIDRLVLECQLGRPVAWLHPQRGTPPAPDEVRPREGRLRR